MDIFTKEYYKKTLKEAKKTKSSRFYFNVALLNEHGLGTKKDFKKALKYFKLAAKYDPTYYVWLGRYYLEDHKYFNLKEAMKCFNIALEKGDYRAYLDLGKLYYYGK